MGDEVSSVNAEKLGRTLLSVKLTGICVKFSKALVLSPAPDRWLEMPLMAKIPVLTLTCKIVLVDAKISLDSSPGTA